MNVQQKLNEQVIIITGATKPRNRTSHGAAGKRGALVLTARA